MSKATVEISYTVGGPTDGGGPTQTMTDVIEMEYNYILANTWTSSNGRFGCKLGTWRLSQDSTKVFFSNEKGTMVAELRGLKITSSFGYPFTGMKGQKGIGWFLTGSSRGFDYAFTDV